MVSLTIRTISLVIGTISLTMETLEMVMEIVPLTMGTLQMVMEMVSLTIRTISLVMETLDMVMEKFSLVVEMARTPPATGFKRLVSAVTNLFSSNKHGPFIDICYILIREITIRNA